MIDQLNLNKFNEIYAHTYDIVEKYVFKSCSNVEDVNDIIQEVYIEVYKVLERVERADSLEAYILGIAKNKVRRHYSLLYRMKTVSLFSSRGDDAELMDTLEDSEVDLEGYVIDKSHLEMVWNFLKTKRPIIQKVFYCYYRLDMSIKEICFELELSESNVKNYLYRTLKEIKDLFTKEA